MNGYLDKIVRPLVLRLSKMIGYVKIFKVNFGNKDKSNKLVSFCLDDKNLSQKYKTIWTKVDDLKN